VNDAVRPIPKRELLAYQADVKGSIFRQIRETFSRLKRTGFTQKDLAIKIGMNEGQLSRRLRGDYDLRLETLSDLARGLDCRIDVRLTPLSFAASLTPPAYVVHADADRWGKYDDDMPLQPLKEWPIKEGSTFAAKLAKPSARRLCTKEQRMLRNKRWFGKSRVLQDHIFARPKKSEISAKWKA
jgi:transcriptional regulator with XRE-family HTH domain